MSWQYRGRTYHNYQEYQRRRSEDEASDLRSTNSALHNQTTHLRNAVSGTREELRSAQNDIRQAARVQAKMQERQREIETIQNQIQQRQSEFETRTTRRQQELEAEIKATDERAAERVETLRQETSQQINHVRAEVNDLREQMDEELSEVRNELQETRQYLETQIDSVRTDLEAERRRRVAKEEDRAAQARSIVDWVQERMLALGDMDALGLSTEQLRIHQSLERAIEMLNGDDKEMARPVADTLFTSYQTAYFEKEKRTGIMEGVAEHVQELAAAMAAISLNRDFQVIFKVEAEQLERAVAWLQAQANDWRTRQRWTAFETERDRVVNLANDLLTRALELEALVPNVLQQLQKREQRLKEVGSAVAAIAGAVDKFETGYANPGDVKSPRLLRGRIGQACIDTYIDLDGTYRVDAYGFTSSGQCGEAAARMGRKLAELWHITEEHVDSGNPQQPSVVATSAGESWEKLSTEFSSLTEALPHTRGKGK